MGILSYILLGVSLSMDALAVAVTTGICIPQMSKKHALRIAAYFGGFQALMPVVGWFLGNTLAAYIATYDHWIAFGLLAFIGIKMIVDAANGGDDQKKADMLSHRVLFTMAIATSIDALAVGVTLGLVGGSIVWGAATIGIITFIISFLGAIFGCRLGKKFEKRAAIIGGLVLIGIGTKILIEHLLGG